MPRTRKEGAVLVKGEQLEGYGNLPPKASAVSHVESELHHHPHWPQWKDVDVEISIPP